ncbi:MAG: (2Fe-2S) ferredoxin domain-containing protein, partial [Bacteroidota bacterium]
YKNRKRIKETELSLIDGYNSQKLEVKVCVGTNCYVKKSQKLIAQMIGYVENKGLCNTIDVSATFCMEKCGEGPNVMIGDEHIPQCTFEKALNVLEKKLAQDIYSVNETEELK